MDQLTLHHHAPQPDSITIATSLSLLAYRDEDGVCYVYAPALDLFGYGYSPTEARESFHTALAEMMRYAVAEGTLDKLLSEYGWRMATLEMKTGEVCYQAPDLRELSRRNPDLLDILDRPEFNKYQQVAEVPVLV